MHESPCPLHSGTKDEILMTGFAVERKTEADDPVSGLLSIFDRVAHVTRTITEGDVYLFAGVTGDMSPVHLDAEYAKTLPGGQRVAHGVLILGLMSAASSRWCTEVGLKAFSYGYDRVRFVRPVRFGDTIRVSYRVVEHEFGERRYVAEVEAVNQEDDVVAVARHILWEVLPGDSDARTEEITRSERET